MRRVLVFSAEQGRRRAAVRQLGAALWVEKATAELARIPGRAPGTSALTETERRVAELVARGHTNREVGAALFVSERTVEAICRGSTPSSDCARARI